MLCRERKRGLSRRSDDRQRISRTGYHHAASHPSSVTRCLCRAGLVVLTTYPFLSCKYHEGVGIGGETDLLAAASIQGPYRGLDYGV